MSADSLIDVISKESIEVTDVTGNPASRCRMVPMDKCIAILRQHTAMSDDLQGREISDTGPIEKAWGAYKSGWAKHGVAVSDSDSHAFAHGYLACKEATREPVMVSLRECATAIAIKNWMPGLSCFGWEPRDAIEYAESEWSRFSKLAKAVLDTAGVKYED